MSKHSFEALYCTFFIILNLCSADEYLKKSTIQEPLVSSPLGQIQGTLLTSRLGKPIYAFRGIRYTKPPIGELRFKPPVPADRWEGVLNATEDGASCPQPNTDPVSEDCLFINVYSTKLPQGRDQPKRPVMLYIHPGAYSSVSGRSNLNGPQYLLDHDVVLVTFNYRLATLGFLSMGTKEAPGNNGMKDQVMAMKWVKQNILSFGGNPDDVTLMGYSAGGGSITLHMVSPMSKGLFHKAMAMSYTTLGQVPVPKETLETAKKQARAVKCPDDTPENIINCLKEKSAIDLGNSLPQFAIFGTQNNQPWKPVIEPDFGQERFLTDHPIKLILEGKFQQVPFVIGITEDEFIGPAFEVILQPELLEQLDKEWNKWAPKVFMYDNQEENKNMISESLRKFYFEDEPINTASLKPLMQIYADAITGFGVNRAARLIAEKSSKPVYYYRFSYQGRASHFYLPGTNNTVPFGVAHHDDLIYLFFANVFGNGDPEIKTVEKMTLMWTNFAKTGNPIPRQTRKLDNVKWETFNKETQKFLEIGRHLELKEKMFEKRYEEWNRLFPLSQYKN